MMGRELLVRNLNQKVGATVITNIIFRWKYLTENDKLTVCIFSKHYFKFSSYYVTAFYWNANDRRFSQIKWLYYLWAMICFAWICAYLRFYKPLPGVPPRAGSTSPLGVVPWLSQEGTFLSLVSSLVLHVHVVLSHMCMSYCPTCACRTALHVHLKQCYTPRPPTILYKTGLYWYGVRAWW